MNVLIIISVVFVFLVLFFVSWNYGYISLTANDVAWSNYRKLKGAVITIKEGDKEVSKYNTDVVVEDYKTIQLNSQTINDGVTLKYNNFSYFSLVDYKTDEEYAQSISITDTTIVLANIAKTKTITIEFVSSHLWNLGNWSECSRPYGVGKQTRTVTCFGGDDCPLPKPPIEQECKIRDADWKVSEWSTPTATCGTEKQTRTVTCESAVESECVADKPIAEQIYDTGIECNVDEKNWSMLQGKIGSTITVYEKNTSTDPPTEKTSTMTLSATASPNSIAMSDGTNGDTLDFNPDPKKIMFDGLINTSTTLGTLTFGNTDGTISITITI